ncbi:MAG TPA: ribose-phosphate diphosphokinase [Ideonella sp.]|uniref:ribose-phosphate diphosphokinase n=1 Tax=Ideonella sp. TaxID=1929293 RepID=UPI002E310AF8|nr:ribose-phosphate diphosphokinase [Ideonella sp.]HEX5685029.1 ribose-phosphate diphosphokinase [Ideonella sp.]
MLIFALDAGNRGFAEALARDLDTVLSPHEDRRFEDGEAKLRPLVDPRGSDAYVVHGLHGGPDDSPHDKLARLLMFIATLREHGARRVTAVVPYLAYARKDRQTKPFDPVSQRCVAQLIEAVGTAQIIVLEVHNPAAFQNAFRIPTIHLDARHALDAAVDATVGQGPLVIASPDTGGAKRAQLWREDLEARLERPVGFAMVDKRRSAGLVSGTPIVAGDVTGATVLLFDDLVATGETLQRAALALRAAGARSVVACAAHGLFVGTAGHRLIDGAIDQVFVTDSVPAFRLPEEARAMVTTVSCTPLFARAIRDSHASWGR